MVESSYKSREYFLALLYHYLIFVRNDTEGHNLPLNADIAYALHNIPSMLKVEMWTQEISEAAWKEVWWAAGFRNCRPWFVEVDQAIRETIALGHPILHDHSFDIPRAPK